jgi:hypothetical protein
MHSMDMFRPLCPFPKKKDKNMMVKQVDEEMPEAEDLSEEEEEKEKEEEEEKEKEEEKEEEKETGLE